MIDVDAYLKRLNYRGSITPDAGTLEALHLAHVLAVPFENLSRYHGPPVVLGAEPLFEKIVTHRRGGFCYELNGLFAELLTALGFQIKMLAAGVFRADCKYGPDFDHLVLVVELGQRWIVDVGFGDAYRYPLLLDEPQDQVQGSDTFRFSKDGQYIVLKRLRPEHQWRPLYRFQPIYREYEDFFDMCQFHASSAESPFGAHKIVRIETADGRIALLDSKLTITTNGTKREVELADDEYSKALGDYFGIRT